MVKCSVYKCQSATYKNMAGITFHRFPKDKKLCEAWLINANLESWTPCPGSVICSLHFEQNLLKRNTFRTTLVQGAIPTIFEQDSESNECKENMPTNSSDVQYEHLQPSTSWQNLPVVQQHVMIPQMTTDLQCKENMPTTSSDVYISRKRTATGENISVLQDVQYQNQQPSTSWQNLPVVLVPQIITDLQCKKNIPVSIVGISSQQLAMSHNSPVLQQKKSILQTLPMKSDHSTTIRKLNSKVLFKNKQIKALREKQKRLKKKIATFAEIINNLKTKLNSEDIHVLENIPANNNKDFLNRFLKKVSGSTVEKSYSPELRTFALQLNFFSPRAYNFVRQSFNTVLPHPATISRWYKKVDAKPGFTNESFTILSALSKKYNHKIFVNLILDEMAIRKELVWDGSKFQGRVDTGTEINDDSLPLATQALVLMVNAINYHWKLPIAFFFVTSMNAEQRANVVRMALEMLYSINIFVKSVTFDGAASNISMATRLGCNFSLNNLQPFFYFHNQKIHIFWDPCHMIKLIRNTLGDFKIMLDKDGNQIDFKYFQHLLDIQESKGLHLANKLRQAHIYFTNQKMKVRLATQLFSKSVADALCYCKDELQLNQFQQCAATANFINIINDAFDILNSRSMYSPGFKKALCPANIARTKTSVTMCKDYLSNLKFPDNNRVVLSGRKTGFLGFIICLESCINMFHDLIINEKLRFFPTYAISQDHLEMFFGQMRRRGGYNDNPNTVNFQTDYKKNLIRMEIQLNKEGDLTDDINILKVSSSKNPLIVLNESTPSFEMNTYSDHLDEDDIQCFLEDVESMPLDEFTNQVAIYIAGFVARKVLKNIKCSICQTLVIGEKKNFFNSLIQRKDRGGLTYPSAGVVSVVQECEKYFKADKNMSLFKITNRLMNQKDYSKFFNSGDNGHDINHVYLLIKVIIKFYADTRLKHEARKITTNVSRRNYLKKITLFSNK